MSTDRRIVSQSDFTANFRCFSGGKTPVHPYPPLTPIAARRQRGWRASIGPVTGWVWQSSTSDTTVPTDLLSLLAIAANAYAYGVFAEMLNAHLAAISRSTDASVARLLANDLLFALEPLDVASLAADIFAVSIATARRRVSVGAVPPPLFTINGAHVWTLDQRIQVGGRRVHRPAVTGRERLAEDGSWRHLGRSDAPRVQLCDLLAHAIAANDQSRRESIGAAIVHTIAATHRPTVLRQIAYDLASLLPLMGHEDWRTLIEHAGAKDDEDDTPPPFLVKTGSWVWYRAQFSS